MRIRSRSFWCGKILQAGIVCHRRFIKGAARTLPKCMRFTTSSPFFFFFFFGLSSDARRRARALVGAPRRPWLPRQDSETNYKLKESQIES